MKFLLCLLLYLCVNFVLSTQNRIPDKYKNNPFLMQIGQQSNNRYVSHNPNSLTLNREQLAAKYAHNPFLSQLFKRKESTPAASSIVAKPPAASSVAAKPPAVTSNRLQTIKSHRNYHLLPTRNICGIQEFSDKIAFGHEAAIGEFPWMVLLEYKIKKISIGHKCAGVLINDRYVLTAAHCVRSKSMSISEKLFRVRLGEHDIHQLRDCDHLNDCNDPPLDVEIDETIMHQDYNVNDKSFHNDIALLRLRRNIRMTHFIKPICLPLDGERTKPGVHMHIAGWGLREDDEALSNVKMVADIPYIKDSECKKLWNRIIDINDSQFCAGGMSRTNACKGDSGGSSMATFRNSDQWYAEGIISFGKSECGGDPYPTVYTRVSSYINWILDNLKE